VREAASHSTFWLLLICKSLYLAVVTGILIHYYPFLRDRGFSTTLATIFFSFLPLAQLVGSLVAGVLLDRNNSGPRLVIPFYIATLLGVFILGHAHSYAVILVGTVILGSSLGCERVVLPYFVSRYYDMRVYGQLYGTVYGVAGLAGAAGGFMWGYTFDLTHSYDLIITIDQVAMVIAVILIALLPAYVYAVPTSGPPLAAVDKLRMLVSDEAAPKGIEPRKEMNLHS
jgi:cyanate permease